MHNCSYDEIRLTQFFCCLPATYAQAGFHSRHANDQPGSNELYGEQAWYHTEIISILRLSWCLCLRKDPNLRRCQGLCWNLCQCRYQIWRCEEGFHDFFTPSLILCQYQILIFWKNKNEKNTMNFTEDLLGVCRKYLKLPRKDSFIDPIQFNLIQTITTLCSDYHLQSYNA